MPNAARRLAVILPQEMEYAGRLLGGATAYVAEHRHLRLVDLPFSVDAPESPPFEKGSLPFDAALVWATRESLWIERLLLESIPVIAASGDWPADRIPMVTFGGGAVVEMAIEHLCRRKPASLALIQFRAGGMDPAGQRAQYFERLGKEREIPSSSHVLYRDADPDDNSRGRRAPLNGRTADRLARILRGLKLPAGVWCVDDQLGLRVCETAEGIGLRIPEDLAVLGLGDFRCSIVSRPPLSTIPLPGEMVGYKAFETLDQWLAGILEPTPLVSVRPPPVIVRQSTAGDNGPDPISRALAIINGRACDGITVAELAAQVGISTQTLHARCVGHTGSTPGELIKREKISTAKRLLGDPRLSISQIAGRCGYEQQSNFSNFFRRETGLSPQAWRRANR